MSHSDEATHEDPGEEARLALWAVWQVKNQDTAKYFGAAIAGLIVVFSLAHWVRVIYNKRISKSSALNRYVGTVAHPLRRINKARIVGGLMFQPGNILLAFLYYGFNAGLTFYDHPERAGLNVLAKRFGWYVPP
jgi:hypothetical protein